MATAQEYAAWIVKNADKRGTPEFDTVAQAYQFAKAQETTAATQAQIAPAPTTPTLGQRIVGAGETALALGPGSVAGLIGTVGGTVGGLAQEILGGRFGTAEAAKAVEQAAARGAQAFSAPFQPSTPAGQEMTQDAAQFLATALPPVLPVVAAPGQLVQATRQAAPIVQATARRGAAATQQAAQAAGQAVAKPVQAATTAVRETLGIEPAAPTPAVAGRGSVGAAATPMDLQRVETAKQFDVNLTRGEAMRDSDQLAFEKEQLKGPLGAPLRSRAEESRLKLLQDFDSSIEKTGAESVFAGPSATGQTLVNALGEGYNAAKNKVNVLYKKARKSDEANAQVDLSLITKLGQGDDAIETSLVGYVNDRLQGVEPKIAENAKKQMIRFGIAAEDETGLLVPRQATVRQLEDFRSEMAGSSDVTVPRQMRDETIIKKLVDATTEPVAGPLFKEARQARTDMGRKFENRAIVARLVKNRKGMDDPQVAADQVFKKSILGASPAEITFLKRVLQTTEGDGKQAWKELQGATLKHIRDRATDNVNTDSMGRPVLSADKLNKAVKELDQNGRLDVILGKEMAARVRDLNEVSQYINTVPPGTLINSSGTTMTLVAALGETGLLGGPWITGAREISKMIKSGKTKAKINEALNALPPVQP
jgi:hypothetical protein